MNANKTGNLIYELRIRKGFTQKELAEKCNVSDKAVSKWERGECCPDVTVIPLLAQIFGVEVDSILNGEIPFTQDVSGKNIKEYDFRQPDRYPRYMQREIAMLGEDICQAMNKDFTVTINERCDFSSPSVDQLNNKEFLTSIPQRCFFYDFDYTNIQKGGFTVELDAGLAKALLKQDLQKHQTITDFDLSVFKNYFLKTIFDVICKNIESQTDGKIDLQKDCFEKSESWSSGNNSRQIENRMLLLLTIKGKVGECEGFMNIQFSDVLIERLLMAGYFGNESGKIKFQNLSNIKHKELPDNIFIEFGRFSPENINLEVGSILILDKKETEGLNVVFENRVIHSGKTVSIDEQFGIQIAETVQLNEIVYNEEDYLAIQLGSTNLSKEEIASLHQGSYIILKERAGEMTKILRSGKLLALGEICIADENFAIRIVEVKN